MGTYDTHDKKPFGCGPHKEVHSILYGGRWWFPPNPGHGESCESEVAPGLSQHCTNQLVVGWMQIRVSE